MAAIERYDDDSDEEHASDREDAESRGSSQSSVPTMQLSPLQIRFSQKKMRNVFGDGRLIEEAAAQVKAIRRDEEEAQIYDAAWKLEAPFPPIEVLRWRCKLRDENTGRPLLNERGKEMFEAEEAWFTLDNRRLWCLQKAALKLLPENCTADVIAEVRKDRRMREIRKFRTMDNGQSINVGSVVDGVPFEKWDWRAEHANPNRTTADRLVPPPVNRKGGKGKKGKGGAKGSEGAPSGKGGGKGGKDAGPSQEVPIAAFGGHNAFEQFAAAISAQAAKGGCAKGYKGPPTYTGWDYAGAGWGYTGWDMSGYGKGGDYHQWHGDGSKGRGKGGGKGGGGGGKGGGQGGKGSRRGKGGSKGQQPGEGE